jgi:hypothetical protein
MCVDKCEEIMNDGCEMVAVHLLHFQFWTSEVLSAVFLLHSVHSCCV